MIDKKQKSTLTEPFIVIRESAPFPRTNRQASSLVPRCGVLPARYSAGVEPIPLHLITMKSYVKELEIEEQSNEYIWGSMLQEHRA